MSSYSEWRLKVEKGKEAFEECLKEDKIRQEHKRISTEVKEQHRLCENERFSILKRFFEGTDDKKNTLDDLLKALYMFYRERISKTEDFTITFLQFLDMFPRDVENKNINRRQHVFEAMCRILLAFNFEGNTTSLGGPKKRFYDGMESYIKGKKATEPKDILSKAVNEGSSEGVIDIFIEVLKKDVKELENKQPSCNIDYKDKEDKTKDLFILIQNKYFDVEKSSADKYDVNKIMTRAETMKKKIKEKTGNDADYDIVLMVNNSNLLGDKIKRARHNDFGLVNHIFGTREIDVWFQSLLTSIRQFSQENKHGSASENEETYKKFKRNILKINESNTKRQPLQLKFHQDLIVSLTEAFYNHQKLKQRDFIWGAVPRSGKSYMIGGLVDRRSKTGNNVLLVLGAKTETEQQFKEMFLSYDNFMDYQIVTSKTDINTGIKAGKDKYILILSQEKIKINDFAKLKKDFAPIFDDGNKIDLYFDEIHKGGSTKKAKDDVVDVLSINNLNVEIFVMVTATYAKPNIAYSGKVGENKTSQIFNWAYEDQQLMKEINNPLIEAQFRDRMDDGNELQREIKKETLDTVFERERLKIGPSYLDNLARQYAIYPELVMVQPFIKAGKTPEEIFKLDTNEDNSTNDKFNLHKEIFMLKCTAIPTTKAELTNPADIFQNSGGVEKLVDFIGKSKNIEQSDLKGKVLDPECVYGMMRDSFNYDTTSRRHTELWFLPDKDLYRETEMEECRKRAKDVYKDNKKEGNITLEEEVDEESKSSGLPNIEPLARGLTMILMKNSFFKNNYHIAIVNNQKVDQYKIDNKELAKDFYKDLFKEGSVNQYPGGKTALKGWIEDQEAIAYQNNKSLIVLTGAMLRLGISLPCADIAFNMDSVKSIDVNYQTMFRVLTERENKQYGYYFDFYPERSISFLYDYSTIYSGGGSKKKVGLELVQSLLPQFNYNGMGIIKQNSGETLELYSNLIEKLQLTESDYEERVIQSDRRHIITVKLLSNIPESVLNELKKTFAPLLKHKQLKKQKKGKLNEVLKPGKGKEEYDKFKKKEEKEEKEEKTPIKILADHLNDTTVMMAFFSQENKNCDSIEACLDNLISSANSKKDIEDLCKCNADKYDALGCYILRLEELDLKQYKSFLEGVLLFHTSNNSVLLSIQQHQNLIFSNIKKRMTKLSGEKEGLIFNSSYEEILNLIEDYLPVKETEKNKFGEVFTPPELIEEMLDQLPKSVWNNPDLKWLDPANGVGNFPMIAFAKLDKGLEGKMPDKKKRQQHIVKNMLYMVELNEKNVAVSRKVFGKDANIYCGSFLEDGWEKAFGIDKFDVIMGNPPYNSGGVAKGGGVFWKNFVFKSINNMVKGGYLTFVHPLGWRKPKGDNASAGDVWERYRNGNLIALAMNNLKKYPGFPQVDFYTWQNIDSRRDTYVKCKFNNLSYEGKLDLYKLPFIPHFVNPTIISLILKLISAKGDKLDIIRNQSFKPTKEMMENPTGIPYAFYYDIDENDYLFAYNNKNKVPDYASKTKVIMTYKAGKKKAKLFPKFYSTTIGSTANTMYQLVNNKEQGLKLVDFFNSDLINAILKITQFSEPPNYINEYKILNLFPNIVFSSLPKFTNQEKSLIKQILNEDVSKKKQTRKIKLVDKLPTKKTRKSSSKSSSSSSVSSKSKSHSKSKSQKGGKITKKKNVHIAKKKTRRHRK